MIVLISLIAFCYLYNCYSYKKLYGLQIIALSIIVSEILSFYTNFKILSQIVFFIGSLGFIPILRPIKLSIISSSNTIKDFSFFEAASIAILLSYYILNIFVTLRII
ncbi:hypothetical protein FQT05_06955 [Enterococcus hirae]|nr:hypothetical protein [Enterococcus hirae]